MSGGSLLYPGSIAPSGSVQGQTYAHTLPAGGADRLPNGHPIGPSRESATPLESLSSEQLVELLSDQAALNRFLSTCLNNTPAARALTDVQQQNVSLAESNLELAAAIEEAKNQVAIVRSSEYAAQKSMFDTLYKRQAAVSEKLNPKALMVRLAHQTDQLNQESEGVVDGFESGSLTVEHFVEHYSALRTKFHEVDLKRQAVQSQLP